MKKFLPIIILVLGVAVLAGSFIFIKGLRQKGEATVSQDETVLDIPIEKRPVASLTPSTDGHWLKLKVEKIVISAVSMDYELLYQLPDGRTQGVPGTIKLEGNSEIERDLLMGSESSGKFRYDEGVEKGTLTLKFRNDKGKLVARFTSDFHLQSKTDTLTSQDNEFIFKLFKSSKEYFVTMSTFGYPIGIDNIQGEPYGVFSSAKDWLEGKVEKPEGDLNYYGGKEWMITSSLPPNQVPGIYIK